VRLDVARGYAKPLRAPQPRGQGGSHGTEEETDDARRKGCRLSGEREVSHGPNPKTENDGKDLGGPAPKGQAITVRQQTDNTQGAGDGRVGIQA
jgi:hypothetical protein